MTTAEAVRRSLALRDFLTWGGAEVVLADSEELKRSLLDSYLDVMLFRENRAREEAPLRSAGVAARFPGRSGDVVTRDGYPNGVASGTSR